MECGRSNVEQSTGRQNPDCRIYLSSGVESTSTPLDPGGSTRQQGMPKATMAKVKECAGETPLHGCDGHDGRSVVARFLGKQATGMRKSWKRLGAGARGTVTSR